MAEETQYTARTGLIKISTANSNLDGTGSLTSLITGNLNGTLVKSISIKAIESTSAGMIRIFVKRSTSTQLLTEIPVPAIDINGITPAFETCIDLNYTLASGAEILASTQNAESFNIIGECLDWEYYSPAVRQDTTQYTSNNGVGQLTTANPNLDGTGDIVLIYRTGSGFKGNSIKSITIKSIQAVSPGMVRLFITDSSGSNTYLYKEIVVPTETPSATDQTFEHTITFENDFELESNCIIYGSTQNSETFNVLIEGNEWDYAN